MNAAPDITTMIVPGPTAGVVPLDGLVFGGLPSRPTYPSAQSFVALLLEAVLAETATAARSVSPELVVVRGPSDSERSDLEAPATVPGYVAPDEGATPRRSAAEAPEPEAKDPHPDHARAEPGAPHRSAPGPPLGRAPAGPAAPAPSVCAAWPIAPAPAYAPQGSGEALVPDDAAAPSAPDLAHSEGPEPSALPSAAQGERPGARPGARHLRPPSLDAGPIPPPPARAEGTLAIADEPPVDGPHAAVGGPDPITPSARAPEPHRGSEAAPDVPDIAEPAQNTAVAEGQPRSGALGRAEVQTAGVERGLAGQPVGAAPPSPQPAGGWLSAATVLVINDQAAAVRAEPPRAEPPDSQTSPEGTQGAGAAEDSGKPIKAQEPAAMPAAPQAVPREPGSRRSGSEHRDRERISEGTPSPRRVSESAQLPANPARTADGPARPVPHEGRPDHVVDHKAMLEQLRAAVIGARQLTRVKLDVHPPELGSIEISVESRDGRLGAHFHSTHAAVHGWLQASAAELRSQLADAGLLLHDLTLSTSAQDGGPDWHFEPAPAAPPARPAHPSATPAGANPGELLPGAHGLVDYLA